MVIKNYEIPYIEIAVEIGDTITTAEYLNDVLLDIYADYIVRYIKANTKEN